MSDLPLGKIILALIFIIVIFKTTIILMWTMIAAVVVYLIKLTGLDKYITK
jgi:hypothetical protein